MQRGEVWWVQIPEPVGSSPGYRRPAVIIQSNRFNDSRLNMIIVVVITANLERATSPGNVTFQIYFT